MAKNKKGQDAICHFVRNSYEEMLAEAWRFDREVTLSYDDIDLGRLRIDINPESALRNLDTAIKVRILASQPDPLPYYYPDSPLVVRTDRMLSL